MTWRECFGCREAGTIPMAVAPVLACYDPQIPRDGPTVMGTGLSAYNLAQRVWAEGDIESVMDDYEISRAAVIAACWWAGTHGRKAWRVRFGVWAAEASRHLFHGCGQIPDPPRRPRP